MCVAAGTADESWRACKLTGKEQSVAIAGSVARSKRQNQTPPSSRLESPRCETEVEADGVDGNVAFSEVEVFDSDEGKARVLSQRYGAELLFTARYARMFMSTCLWCRAVTAVRRSQYRRSAANSATMSGRDWLSANRRGGGIEQNALASARKDVA